jgi:hypothetical protein
VSLALLLVLWPLPMLLRGHVLLVFMVGGGLQLVVLLLLPVVVVLLLELRVLHVVFLKMLALVFGRLLLHLLMDIEMLLIGRLVALLFVL